MPIKCSTDGTSPLRDWQGCIQQEPKLLEVQKKKERTYCHMWWSCKESQKYWLRIKKWLEEIMKKQIELKPELFLLGIFRKKHGEKVKYKILHILTAARLAFG
uniref:Uncharacterized protein n=1 Tax=Micrurus spixii TaxID=129469 RepID=A0A2D4M2G6_9SAUR